MRQPLSAPGREAITTSKAYGTGATSCTIASRPATEAPQMPIPQAFPATTVRKF